MIQRVCRQMQNNVSSVPVTVATGREQISLIWRQLGLGGNISIEPCWRDTFLAISLVCAYLHEVRGVSLDEVVAIRPADPYVDEDHFRAVLQLLREAEGENYANCCEYTADADPLHRGKECCGCGESGGHSHFG